MNKLVINNRLVGTFIKILNSLYIENMSVNEIIEQTSSDRTFVIKALRELEKAELIETIKNQSHKQKKVKQLSKLGKTVAQLTFNIEKFNSGHFEINNVINEYNELDKKSHDIKEKNKPLTTIKKNTIRKSIFRELVPIDRSSQRFLVGKLKEKGWTDTEISYYEGCKEGLYYTDIQLHEGTIKILLQKFLIILDNFNLNVGAREIINRIIIEKLQTQLSNIVTNIRSRYSKYLVDINRKNINKKDYSIFFPNFKDEPLDYIRKLMFPFSLSVMGIVENMMICYLNLLKPSKEIIEPELKDMRNDIENASSYEINEGDISREELIICSRCLINTYEKYLKSN